MIVINLAIVILSFFNATELAQNVEVRVTGIRNNKGFIVISVFKDQSTFAKERPLFTKKFDKTPYFTLKYKHYFILIIIGVILSFNFA